MQDNSSHTLCSSQDYEIMTGKSRRGFLEQLATLVFGGLALLVPGVAGLVAFLNPLRQKSRGNGLPMRLALLDTLPKDGTPCRFPVIADRVDAWNRFPAEPIGAVFLRRVVKKDEEGNETDEVKAFQVICPHAGCSISVQNTPQGTEFLCPCHAARFDLDGQRLDAISQSPRNMDSLNVEVKNNEVWVNFETFRLGTADKIALG